MLQDSQQAGSKQKIFYKNNPPPHIAIIMDGNGRWAQQQKKPRIFGHKRGLDRVREVIKNAINLNIKYLTLYAFSEENWGRPKAEVSGIMSLLDSFILKERNTLNKNNIRLTTIGRLEMLPKRTRSLIEETQRTLASNTGLYLNIAISYGSRTEISDACKRIAQKVHKKELSVEDIVPDLVEQHLWTASIPDPDLLIRTSGEQRISNFLLWQMAYCELWFSPVFWPDFSREHLIEALISFEKRKRRFGLLDAPQAHVST